jgi:hypothetical protein
MIVILIRIAKGPKPALGESAQVGREEAFQALEDREARPAGRKPVILARQLDQLVGLAALLEELRVVSRLGRRHDRVVGAMDEQDRGLDGFDRAARRERDDVLLARVADEVPPRPERVPVVAAALPDEAEKLGDVGDAVDADGAGVELGRERGARERGVAA